MTVEVKTSYNLMDKLVKEVSPKYFEDIDDHRSATFGYINESFGLLADNNILSVIASVKNLLMISADREYLLKSSFGTGETYNLFAKPAKMTYTIGVPRELIISEEKKDDAQIEYILDDFTIDYDGLYYILNNKIEITAINNHDGTYNFSSRLLNAVDLQNPKLFTVKDTIEGKEHILIRVDLHQIRKKTKSRPILGNDISLKNLEYSFDSQISKIEATYKPPGGQAEKLEIYNKYSVINTENKYLTYFIDEAFKILRLDLSAFEPIYNSELTVDIYETRGAVGNFKNSRPIVNILDNDFIYATPISDSSGGENVIETEKLREKVIRNIATLNSIDNEKDLESQFETQNTNNLISNLIRRKRDDVRTMEYTNYMLFRDNDDNSPIPTNTLNMKIKHGDEDLHHTTSDRRVYLPGTKFSLKDGEARLLEKNSDTLTDDQIKTIENDNTKLLFGLPFLMIISEAPDLVGYYINSVNNECPTEVEFNNTGTEYQFICNRIGITRNAIKKEPYKMKANVIWNSMLPKGLLNEDNTVADASLLKCFIFMYDEDNNIIGYKPMSIESYNPASNFFVFENTIATDDYINEYTKMRLTDMIKPGAKTPSEIMVDGGSGKFAIAIYVKDPANSKGAFGDIVPEMDGYSLSNIYSSNKMVLYRNINNINSGVKLSVEESTNYINLVDVPLVKYSYLLENVEDISNLISDSFDLNYKVDQLINEDIDMKFFNCYGTSRYFKNNGKSIGNVNGKMVIRIFFDDFVADTYKDEIKLAISKQIDADNQLVISKLYSNLYSKFTFDSVEIISVDGIDNIYKDIVLNDLKFDNSASPQEIREYVTEKLNIHPDNITIESHIKQ